jgi:formate dehydrogenase major subunit
MIAAVNKAGKLISMEGDYDHIVSRGSLCVKGISMFATHASPKRLTKPLYRAPGSDHWEELEWKDAAERVARKIKKTRRDLDRDRQGRRRRGPTNCTDAIAFLGGAQNTNEECCSRRRLACSAPPSWSTRPVSDTVPRSPVWGSLRRGAMTNHWPTAALQGFLVEGATSPRTTRWR